MVRKGTDTSGRAVLLSETFSILKHWDRSILPYREEGVPVQEGRDQG